ncbi:MAG: hypothetical protein MI861_10920, partial [Pirellulales bacterium]|nr:hypothetical protein [Pirellulales bacterium]
SALQSRLDDPKRALDKLKKFFGEQAAMKIWKAVFPDNDPEKLTKSTRAALKKKWKEQLDYDNEVITTMLKHCMNPAKDRSERARKIARQILLYSDVPCKIINAMRAKSESFGRVSLFEIMHELKKIDIEKDEVLKHLPERFQPAALAQAKNALDGMYKHLQSRVDARDELSRMVGMSLVTHLMDITLGSDDTNKLSTNHIDALMAMALMNRALIESASKRLARLDQYSGNQHHGIKREDWDLAGTYNRHKKLQKVHKKLTKKDLVGVEPTSNGSIVDKPISDPWHSKIFDNQNVYSNRHQRLNARAMDEPAFALGLLADVIRLDSLIELDRGQRYITMSAFGALGLVLPSKSDKSKDFDNIISDNIISDNITRMSGRDWAMMDQLIQLALIQSYIREWKNGVLKPDQATIDILDARLGEIQQWMQTRYEDNQRTQKLANEFTRDFKVLARGANDRVGNLKGVRRTKYNKNKTRINPPESNKQTPLKRWHDCRTKLAEVESDIKVLSGKESNKMYGKNLKLVKKKCKKNFGKG